MWQTCGTRTLGGNMCHHLLTCLWTWNLWNYWNSCCMYDLFRFNPRFGTRPLLAPTFQQTDAEVIGFDHIIRSPTLRAFLPGSDLLCKELPEGSQCWRPDLQHPETRSGGSHWPMTSATSCLRVLKIRSPTLRAFLPGSDLLCKELYILRVENLSRAGRVRKNSKCWQCRQPRLIHTYQSTLNLTLSTMSCIDHSWRIPYTFIRSVFNAFPFDNSHSQSCIDPMPNLKNFWQPRRMVWKQLQDLRHPPANITTTTLDPSIPLPDGAWYFLCH